MLIWDLVTGLQIGAEPVFPSLVKAVAPGGRLVVAFGWEVAVLAPQLVPGGLFPGADPTLRLFGHTVGVGCATQFCLPAI